MQNILEVAMSAKTPLAIVGLLLALSFFALKPLLSQFSSISRAAKAKIITIVVIGGFALIALALGSAFYGFNQAARRSAEGSPSTVKDGQDIHLVTRAEMPCRWAWVFLGRYSNSKGSYETKEAFRYADGLVSHGPIPVSGNSIVITSQRTLIITNYTNASTDHKCDSILVPPSLYRPETELQFKAGVLPVNSEVMVNLITLLPSIDAEPAYVWGLVGPER